ncbi:MAG: O-antigen ligase family protein [Alphaproteobacteria bacterium]|nr:O-antigen ligase family protein [Alphaproteobacteria bacterium]
MTAPYADHSPSTVPVVLNADPAIVPKGVGRFNSWVERLSAAWPSHSWPLIPMLIALVSVPAAAKLSVLWLPMAAILALLVGSRPAGAAAWGKLLPLILLLSLVWAGLSLLWTPNVDNGLRAFLDTASLALAGGILLHWCQQSGAMVRAVARKALLRLYFPALFLLLLLVITHRLALHEIVNLEWAKRANMTDRGSIMMALLLWPCLALLRGRWYRLSLWMAVALVVLISNSLAAKLVVLLGGVTFLLARWRYQRVVGALPLIGLGLLLLMPMVVQSFYSWGLHSAEWLPASSRHRVMIWDFVARQAATHPWLGWGINAARDFPNMGEVPMLGDRMIPMHPHNGVLQLWLEFGAVGIGLCALWWLGLCRSWQRMTSQSAASDSTATDRHAPWHLAATIAQVVGILIVVCTSFSLWASYWQAWIWLIVGFSTLTLNQNRG